MSNKEEMNNINNNNESQNNNEKDNNIEKNELQAKIAEKYFKLVDNCLLGFKDKIRIMKRSYENDTIKIFIEILKNGEKELIHLKNAMFYTNDEIIDNLINKFNKIVKTHHPK
jgi:hypothetical protein